MLIFDAVLVIGRIVLWKVTPVYSAFVMTTLSRRWRATRAV